MNESQYGLRGRTASPADDADRAVLALVADGQLDSLQDLYDRYKTMAYSIAFRITSDASLAEDVVQDAFLGVWRNAGRYVEGRGSVKTWVLAIVHHRAVDAVRRRRPTTELPEREDVPPPALQLPDIWQDVAAGLDRDEIAAAIPSGPRSRPCRTSSVRRSRWRTGAASRSRRSPSGRARHSGR